MNDYRINAAIEVASALEREFPFDIVVVALEVGTTDPRDRHQMTLRATVYRAGKDKLIKTYVLSDQLNSMAPWWVVDMLADNFVEDFRKLAQL